jgi:PAS domain S-box-containing protein
MDGVPFAATAPEDPRMRLPAPLRDPRRAATGLARAVQRIGGLLPARDEVEKLRESEARFRLLAENARDLIYRYRLLPTAGFEYVSPSSTEIVGYTPEEHYADPGLAHRIVHPHDRHLLEASGRSPDEPIVLRWLRKDGTVIWTELRNRSIYDASGELVAIEGIARDITAYKKAEEELKESEERFRAAFGSAAIGMSLTSTDGRYRQVNTRMCEITGYSEEELVGTDFRTITHPDDLEADLDGFHRLLSGEARYYHSEKRYVHSEGHPVWVRLSSSVVHDPRGEPLYFVTQVQDVTASKKDKEDIERLSHQNELILASAGEGIYGLDLREQATFVNPAAEKMLGYEPGELAGRHQHDIIRHLRADGTSYGEDDCPVFAALKRGGVHASSDEVFWRKDGTSFPVEYVSTPIRHDGEVLGAVVTFRDITERRRTEEALRESEARFRLLAEKTSDLICLHEPDGRYIYLSPSCQRLLGYEPAELLGADPYTLFHPEDSERIRSESHASALEGHGAVSVTYRIRKKSGEYVWFETLTEPIVDEKGDVVRLQTSSRDVSDRKRVEEALAEAARAKTEFLAEVSHELRTPLTVVRGNAEVGLELERGCAHEEILEEIVKESATMSRMVEDLLFLARSDSLSPPFELQPVAVEPFLAGLAKGAEALLGEHGALLETDLAGTGRVRMDPARVKQAVLALLDNAAKYGPKGGRVSLRSATPDGQLCVEVEDHGPGISSEHLPHVFERFYRVDDAGEPGSGLGLSIAKSIAEAHGGRIEAVSRPGEGTMMKLHLPLLASLPNGYDQSSANQERV